MANIFTKTDSNASPGIGVITPDQQRVNVLKKDEADSFNTYRNFYDILAPVEGITVGQTTSGTDGKKSVPVKETYDHLVKKPLFNSNFGVSANLNYQERMNMPLADLPEIRERMHQRDACTIKDLVDMAGDYGRIIYSYADFMYCKYLGRTSNNYLITLRRFPFPCGDHIGVYDPESKVEKEQQKHYNDIGRMVTWLGTPGNEMSNIMKYSMSIPYEEMNAEIQDVNNDGDGGGLLGNLMNMTNPTWKQQVLSGEYGSNAINAVSSSLAKTGKLGAFLGSGMQSAPGKNRDLETYHDKTKLYGPADVITSTYRRKGAAEGGGLKFEHSITLTFDYELRSYDGINGRAAMLDLLGNILATTYTNATFWGGAYRMTGASQSNAFANLPIYKLNSKNLSLGGIYDAFTDSLTDVGEAFNGGQKIQSPGDVINALKNIGSSLGNLFMGSLLNKLGRPKRAAISSLLSDAPAGPWHLMVGNPKHPILSIGNLIIEKTEIEHYGKLNIDGFPTGLRVTVTLKHGKPRDNQLIEMMYTGGDYRVYMPLVGVVNEIWESAAKVKGSSNTAKQGVNKTQNPAEEVERTTSSSYAQKKNENGENTTETETETRVRTEGSKEIMRQYTGYDEPEMIAKAAMEAWRGSEDPKKKKADGAPEASANETANAGDNTQQQQEATPQQQQEATPQQ